MVVLVQNFPGIHRKIAVPDQGDGLKILFAVFFLEVVHDPGFILAIEEGESQYRGVSEENVSGKNVEFMFQFRNFETVLAVKCMLGGLPPGQGGIQQAQIKIGLKGGDSASDAVFQQVIKIQQFLF
jgi:hypothetical protein